MNFGKLPFCIRPFVEACKPLGHVTPIPIFGGNMHFLGHFPGPSDIYIYIYIVLFLDLFVSFGHSHSRSCREESEKPSQKR